MKPQKTVDRATWEAERLELMAAEKEFTRQRDALSAKRREMPWVKIEKDYRFETERGEESLLELFGDHDQLVIYHFMYGLDWKQGCKSCSFWADGFDHNTAHFAARDVSFKVISRAPLNVFMPFKKNAWVGRLIGFRLRHQISTSISRYRSRKMGQNATITDHFLVVMKCRAFQFSLVMGRMCITPIQRSAVALI